jgi:hypothetical protein
MLGRLAFWPLALWLLFVLLAGQIPAVLGEDDPEDADDGEIDTPMWKEGMPWPPEHWGDERPRPPGWYVTGHGKVRNVTQHTFDRYVVGGVNIAAFSYDNEDYEEQHEQATVLPNAKPYKLYDSFSLADQITGDEGWWDLIRYRQLLQRPVNSFYYDKVALKRWLPTIDVAIPESYLIKYGKELSSSGDIDEETEAILKLLPSKKDFAAKPSHMSFKNGLWLIKYDEEKDVELVSKGHYEMKEMSGRFQPIWVAETLAEHLHDKPLDYESWTLHNVEPGVIVEERFTSIECDCPPIEANVFVIWGRVWMAEVTVIEPHGNFIAGWVYRNGTVIPRTGFKRNMFLRWPWINWQRVVNLAERVGAHKDMLRVDVFVGFPYATPISNNATAEEKAEAVEYVVSEIAFHPTTYLDKEEIREEGARLWLAGYLIGNYIEVPNDEVPEIFQETGMLPSIWIQGMPWPPDNWGDERPRPPGWYVTGHRTVRRATNHTLPNYPVGGVNLAAFSYDEDYEEQKARLKPDSSTKPYELFDSFSLADQITGEEGWWDLIRYRQLLQRPANSFYYDKVALKRWIPTIGLEIPESYLIKYGVELTDSDDVDDQIEAILPLVPSKKDFCAKPAHMSFRNGLWLVKYDKERDMDLVTRGHWEMEEVKGQFQPIWVASTLAEHLHDKPLDYESWTLHNVKPGIIIEERYTSIECDCPPIEANVFVIWGRVWMAEVNFIDSKGGWIAGWVLRDGTVIENTGVMKNLFHRWPWFDWSRVVEIAERLGANKDMLRVDIFVGFPYGTVISNDATVEEKAAAVKYVVSELAFHPTTYLDIEEIREEGARLWLAGYLVGNYVEVPNTEVPKVFHATGMLPLESLHPDVPDL